VAFVVNVRASGPVAFHWSVDGVEQRATGNQFVLATRSGDSGVRTVYAEVQSEQEVVSLVWRITLVEGIANDPPVIASAMPPGDVSVTRGSKVAFSITATDPDVNDALSYSWLVDGTDQRQNASWVNLDTAFLSTGTHTVETRVSDGEEPAAHAWTVTVQAPVVGNAPPEIDSAAPQGAVQVQAGSTLNLEVSGSDPDGDPLAFRWTVDGLAQSAREATFSYLATAADVGVHAIGVTVHDGVNNGQDPSYTWNVTVVDDSSVDAQLAWDPVLIDVQGHAEGVAGYRVYLAKASQAFGAPVSTVKEPQVDLRNLERGVNYYVAVSAFDQAGNESQLSQPLAFTLP
jgi:hypothetical protein